MLKMALALGAAVLLSSSIASAQEPEAAKACAADIKSQCAGVQPGEGRVQACVKAHFKELSEPCQALLMKAAAVGKACLADVKQHCADVKPGEGRIEACMKSHISDLSEPCKDALSEASAGRT